ncbi:hypothetical protein Glove_340g73 [Diversispora epigaea]|uniref:Uncharacterized protein n=1 Tax=Diversispora epigaea TaxID=1348612 RepID=A0A397HLB0_9GLOM|nr:hypothetical protein Glove_340g73 [Diversispora epigaea]
MTCIEYTQEESKKWWLPKNSTCATLDSNSWNESLKKRGHRSLFSIQMVVPTIAKPENLQSSQCLRRNMTDYVQLPEGENTPPKRLKKKKRNLQQAKRNAPAFIPLRMSD